jgi:signal transduction histidine kinase/CheY-like chemotaxis protein
LKLRTQILIFLLVFGLTPLIAAVLINVPLVFGSLELFYHKAHLQNLRADFRDLDQHLASRHEMVRLLAKLPEPGTILGETDDAEQVDVARARYTQWINQILHDQLDIIQILFLDETGQERFWLERDPETQQWRPTLRIPDRPPEDFIRTVTRMELGGVLVSRIRLNPELGRRDSRRLMNLYLISPVYNPPDLHKGPIGSVIMSIDVGGLAEFYRNTLWVNDNGSYLQQVRQLSTKPEAFEDFPGLEQIFAKSTLDLWKGPRGEQILWVPLFLTENSGPLWVGRQVDPSPLAAFRNALMVRVLMIILVLIVMVLIMARWIAVRLERFGHELTRGIGGMLQADEAISFDWPGPQEVKALGRDLTALARSHAEHARALRQHASELEQSNRYKSEFLANVSHELRTPLNSILLLSKMLADPDANLSSEQVKQARVIHHAGKDLQALINNILEHSRIEARETVINLDWFEPEALLRELMDLVNPQFEQKGLYLRLEVTEDAPRRIRSDREKLSQVLKNFLANAVKFTESGGVRIRMEAAGLAACPLAIRVTDTGIGIPEGKQELVFEAFKQADGSTSRRYGGTGLGLSISRELAQLLGGMIELESAAGKGSTFSLLLPLDPRYQAAPPAAVGDQALPSSEAAAIGGEAPRADFAGRCVLVVERDVNSLLQLTPLLESWGLRVSVAADTDEALESLREEDSCAAILLNPEMPGHDGYATIGVIRRERGFGSLPIIVMTDPANTSLAERCIEAGADDVLTGPLDPTRLKEILERHLTAEPVSDLIHEA